MYTLSKEQNMKREMEYNALKVRLGTYCAGLDLKFINRQCKVTVPFQNTELATTAPYNQKRKRKIEREKDSGIEWGGLETGNLINRLL